ncbi:hypothetical protein ACK1SI_001072 [Enterobacter kobei]
MKISVFKDQKKEFICRSALMASDFFWLNASLGLSFLTVMFFIGDLNTFMPIRQIDVRVLSHVILTALCVFWFGVRLRHYAQKSRSGQS